MGSNVAKEAMAGFKNIENMRILVDALNRAFIWEETVEGQQFWKDLRERCRNAYLQKAIKSPFGKWDEHKKAIYGYNGVKDRKAIHLVAFMGREHQKNLLLKAIKFVKEEIDGVLTSEGEHFWGFIRVRLTELKEMVERVAREEAILSQREQMPEPSGKKVGVKPSWYAKARV